ncbi:MAG TPA: sodium:solute symporter [Hyphomicrobiaceae bacterium]|nr:sodium:solute symporter [Hyphomicrobiaceae bacterium]
MTLAQRTRLVNPRLGTYFGIFMSAFAALALLSLIFEGLGAPGAALRWLMFAGPLILYAVIGVAAFTRDPIDYFAAGRRVPAFYSGLVLSQTAMGATGLLALAGAFFVIGFDALCLVIGGLAGFVVMAVMLAPFLRKFGAFTIASYLGRRFDSRILRIFAATLLAVPVLLMLAAELRMGAFAASWLVPLSPLVITAVLVAVLVVSLGAGGMRSLTWSATAQSLASLIALLVPVTIVAVLVTGLPLPQLSSGPVLRLLGRAEAAQGLPLILPPALAFDMPGEGLSPIAKRYSDALGSVGPAAFVLMMLSTMAGIAGSPWLLPRVATTPGVYEARKSLGWATFLFGIAMLTLAAGAIFMRDYVMDIVKAPGPTNIPEWFNQLTALQVAAIDTEGQHLGVTSFSLRRDAVLMILAIAGGLPSAVLHVAAAGAVAAALAAAGAATVALGNLLAEDVVYGLSWEPAPAGMRVAIARTALVAAAVLGGVIAHSAPTDPLRLMLWSLALTGSTAFPILVLSVWWKRINAFGATAGLVVGFSVAVLAILGREAGWIELDSALAGALGIPAGLLATIAVTLLTPPPSRHALELVRELRVAGGEVLYDREVRLQHRRGRHLD